MAQAYEALPEIYNTGLSSIDNYKHLKPVVTEYVLESEPILEPILHANRDTKKGKELKPNYSGHFWKSVVTFSVPIDENHDFWQQSRINLNQSNFRNSIPVQVCAFGSSKQEAETFSLIKLINLIELVGRILRNKKSKNMEELISRAIKKSTRFEFPDMKCQVLNMGARLFVFHQYQERDKHIWDSMKVLIKKLLEECCFDLKPLLEYYLVYHPFLQN